MKTVLLSLTVFSILCAGGWNQKKHSLFLKLSSRFLSANQLYMADGSLSSVFGTTKIFQNILYAEYGLADRFTLIANIPFYNKLIRNNIEYENSTFIAGAENSGIGDISFGLRFGLEQETSIVWSLLAQIDIGTGNASSITGLYTGDEETNILFGIEMGHSFDSYQSYLTSSIGLNLRGEDSFSEPISNEIIGSFEIGKWFSSNFLSALKLKGVLPVGEIDQLSEFAQSEYISFEIESYFKLTDHYGISASYTNAFEVKNYFDSAIFSIGFVLDIK